MFAASVDLGKWLLALIVTRGPCHRPSHILASAVLNSRLAARANPSWWSGSRPTMRKMAACVVLREIKAVF